MVKANVSKKTKSAKKTSRPPPVAETAAVEIEDAPLMQEILALGGSKKDFEFLQGIDEDVPSTSNASGKQKDVKNNASTSSSGGVAVDDKMLRELESFRKSLGLDAIAETAFIGDDTDDEDAEEEEEDDALSEEEMHVSEPKQAQNESTNTKVSVQTNLPKDSKESKKNAQHASTELLLPITSQWSQIPLEPLAKHVPTPAAPASSRKQKKSPKEANLFDVKQAVDVLREYAQSLLHTEQSAYQAYRQRKAPSDYQWLQTVLQSGTLSDRVSALSLAILESPVHTLQHLDNLVGMSKKKNRREAMTAVDILKDLVVGNGSAGSGLIPGDRKLRFFAEQPDLQNALLPVLRAFSKPIGSVEELLRAVPSLRSSAVAKQHLMLWIAEDRIKTRYYEFIVVLDQLSHDAVQHIKSKVVSHVWDLLTHKKEQERTLLTFLVNKLGDQDRKVASKTGFLLQQLLVQHPLMKMVVGKEVEMLVYRKGVTERTQYYAVVFLNQIVLSKKTPDVLMARYLVQFYFRLFEKIAGIASDSAAAETKDGDGKQRKSSVPGNIVSTGVEAKIMSALLTGINRAFPYASHSIPEDSIVISGAEKGGVADLLLGNRSMEDLYGKHIDLLFKMTHLGNVSFLTSIQALQLIYQILWIPSTSATPDASAGEPAAINTVDNSATAFSPQLTARYYRTLYALLLDPRLSQSTKHYAIFFNLLYKSMKMEPMGERLLAILRRFVQVCLSEMGSVQQQSGICAGLIVLSEVLKSKKEKEEEHETIQVVEDSIRKSIEAVQAKFGAWLQEEDSDDEEHYVDIDEDAPAAKSSSTATKTLQPKDDTTSKPLGGSNSYDPFHRCPEFSHASKSSFWELVPMTQHFHPTVALFARTLLYNGDATTTTNQINYPSDPLEDFTLIRFLDRFVYKNPKKLATTAQDKDADPDAFSKKKSQQRGDSVMQPKAYQSSILRSSVQMNRGQDAPVNSKEWQQRGAEGRVPVDEQFYVPFFQRSKKDKKKDAAEELLTKKQRDSEVVSEEELLEDLEDAEELEDEEVMKAIMNSVPGAEKDDLMPVEVDEGDSEYEADFAAMMEDGESDGSEVEEASEMGSDLEEEEPWSEDGEEEDEESEEEDGEYLFGADGDADSDVDHHREKVATSTKSAKKAQKDAIRNRLQASSTTTPSSGKPPKFDVNAIEPRANSGKSASAGGNVFASMEEYAHLLQLDPDHNDVQWLEHPEAEVKGELLKKAKKRALPSTSKHPSTSTKHGEQQRGTSTGKSQQRQQPKKKQKK